MKFTLIVLSKVGVPVGGFGALIVTILVFYWIYKKDNPGNTDYRIGVDANRKRIKALDTEEVQREIANSRMSAAGKGAFVMSVKQEEKTLDFTGRNLNNASFAGRDLSYAVFDYASLKKADFSYADLDHTSFKGADLTEADLYSANMHETDFRGAKMQCCNFGGCEIMGMIMGDLPTEETDPKHPVVIRNKQGEEIARVGEEPGCTTDLSTAYLNELDLTNANLEGADLSNAYIGFCNLKGANLHNADLSNAKIECCEVNGTDFSGSDLNNAEIDITTDIFRDSITDDETLLPTRHRPSYM